jgi:uncharacterized repeat protein (TIGR01451 family)
MRTIVRFALVVLALILMMLPGEPERAAATTAARPARLPQAQAPTDPQTIDAAWQVWDTLPYALKSKVDPRILAELRGEQQPTHLTTQVSSAAESGPAPDKTRFLIYLTHQPSLAAFETEVFASQTARRSALLNLLLDDAQAAQAEVKAALDAQIAAQNASAYQPFFVVNALAVEGNVATVVALVQRPDVARLIANYPLINWSTQSAPTQAEHDLGAAQQQSANWNIERVEANRVWEELGVRGTGAVVASFDTGVDWLHPAVAERYRGRQPGGGVNHNYHWFEPDSILYPDGNLGASRSAQPYDCSGHGSHTLGTMVGEGDRVDTRIGMAPDATWIALPGICSGTMPGGIRDDIGALKAFQWLLCPTDLTGDLATADCSKAPDVVNNSWGSANPINDLLRPAIQRLRAAGIAPVFASGNPGAGPGSIGSPGNAPEAITVGATDFEDDVAYFSGRGPSFYEGEQKPEFSAPGVDVLSVWAGGGYISASGTSMAAPHVSGLIALLVSADLKDGRRDLTVDEIEDLMRYSALDLGSPGPDDEYGYGRIRAFTAVRWVLTSGDLSGVVRTAEGQPIANALLTVTDTAGNQFTARTDDQGRYATTAPAGVYAISATAWGYASATFADRELFADSQAITDFTLAPLPVGQASGIVRSAGQPVADAVISVAGQPTRQVRSDASGLYTIELPAGTHELIITAPRHRIIQTTLTVTAGGAITQDFTLEPAPSILLVEADAAGGWFFGWPLANLYRTALTANGYSFEFWPIQNSDETDTQQAPDGSLTYGVPSATTLAAYDIVIWAHGGCSFYWGCDYETLDRNLPSYLAGGGRLFFSAQDGSLLEGTSLYDDHLHADPVETNAAHEGDTVHGLDFLQGMQLTLTNASLYGYANGSIFFSPDAVSPQPEDGASYPILLYDSLDAAAGLAVSPCNQPGRALYLAIGYENLGARAGQEAAAELLERSLDWLQAERPAHAFSLAAPKVRATLLPGSSARYDVLVTNTGTQPVAVQVTLAGQRWPSRILQGEAEVSGPIELAPCGATTLTVLVTAPATALAHDQDVAELTVALVDGSASAQSVALTTASTQGWQREPSTARFRYNHGVATLDDLHLYAVGGWISDGSDGYAIATASVERYNLCTQEWSPVEFLPVPRAGLGLAALQGKLYAVGGAAYSFAQGTDVAQRDVFVYNPATNQWSLVAPLPIPYVGMAVAAAGGKLYAFGGVDDDGLESDRSWEYDPAADRWQPRAPMPGGRRAFAAAALFNGQIYVIGGEPGLRRVERYDPATDRWSSAPALHQGRAGAGAVTGPDGVLYVIGGSGPRGGLGSVERYRNDTAGWVMDAPLADGNRAGVGVAYVGGRIVAVGGAQSTQIESRILGASFCNSNKTTANAAIAPDLPVTYTIQLIPGPVDLPTVQLVDSLPPELRFSGFLQNPIGARYNEATRQIEWRGGLQAGAPPTQLSYRAELATEDWSSGDVVTATAYFSAGQQLAFTRTVISVLLAPDFARSSIRADRPRVKNGDELTYTVRLQGSTVAGGALSLVDPLPPQVDYVPESLRFPFGTGFYDPAQRAIHWAGIQPSGSLRTGEANYLWGDSDGQGELPDVTYAWVDLGERATSVPGYDDLYTCDLPIGFAFPYFGQEQTTFCVSTNGFVSFDPFGGSALSNDCPLPSTLNNNAVIAAVWDDLVITGGMSYATLGAAPNRSLVVQWAGVRPYGQSASTLAEFQLILSEDGQIQLQVREAGVITGARSSTGLEDGTGQVGVTYACNRPYTLHDGLAVRFAPNTISLTPTEIHFRVTPAVVGVNQRITNTVTLTTPTGVLKRNVATLVNPVDLNATTASLSPRQVAPTQEVRYQIALRNTGLVDANALVAMTIPTPTTYVAGSLTCGVGLCEQSGNQVQWRGPVSPSGVVTVSFALRLTVPLPDQTPVRTQIEVDDGFGNRFTRSLEFTAIRSDLAASTITMRPPYIEPGGSTTILLFVHNRGTLETEATLTHTPPAALVMEAGSLACSAGVCTLDNGSLTWQGIAPPRGVVQISYRVQAPPTATYGDLYALQMEVNDVTWGDRYQVDATLLVARPFYMPLIHLTQRQTEQLLMHLPLVITFAAESAPPAPVPLPSTESHEPTAAGDE